MCQLNNTFVETMCASKGYIKLMDYHNDRLNRTRREVFGKSDVIDLRDYIDPDVSSPCIKVRVVYGINGILEVTYAPYSPKNIRTLRLITCNDIDYTYKSTDRSALSALAAMKGSCDEILIVKNGQITDTSYTNFAVNINNRWLTPRRPLLKGTRREWLLDKEIITEADIKAEDLTPETDIMLFNGMMDFGNHVAHISY